MSETAASGEPRAQGSNPRFSIDYLDGGRSPSDDFYEFAVGRWRRETAIPADRARWGAFDELEQQNYRALRRILEEVTDPTRPSRTDVERQVGDFFASALDTARRDALGFTSISADLARIERIGSIAQLFEALAGLHRDGFDALFENYVYPDRRRSEVYAFYLEQGGLTLPDRDYYLDPAFEKVRTAYLLHLERSFRSLGDGAAKAAGAARTVLELEAGLARSSRPRADLRDAERNYHRVPTDEFIASHPGLPWRQYLVDRQLAHVPYVIVGQPEFYEELDRSVVFSGLPAWKEYLRWQLLRGSAPYLHTEAEEAHFDFFRRTLLGQPSPEPPWKRAAVVINAELGEALGRLYVERNFPPEARARMQVLIDDLREVFRDRLARLPWMGETTRQRALAKFAKFTSKIGHPDTFRDYAPVRVDRDDYLGNVRRAEAFEVHRQIVRVGGPVDRTEWGMTPPTVNAYFSPVRNEIVFPAGILQPPFFDVAMDDAVNYGGIGTVIGHEITHGYDDEGRKYGADGNLEDWWSVTDAQEFERRAQRVVEEYGGYEALPGLHLNGKLTLGENLADLGGVSIAFEALQRRLAREPKRRATVDGFSPEQRFFLSWAQIWRQNSREPETRRRVVIDPHAPGPFRVRGAISNHDGFFLAFRVTPGSPMWRAPEDRVSLW